MLPTETRWGTEGMSMPPTEVSPSTRRRLAGGCAGRCVVSRAGFPDVSCICPKGHLFLWLQSHATNERWPWVSVLSERTSRPACPCCCYVTVASHASPVS